MRLGSWKFSPEELVRAGEEEDEVVAVVVRGRLTVPAEEFSRVDGKNLGLKGGCLVWESNEGWKVPLSSVEEENGRVEIAVEVRFEVYYPEGELPEEVEEVEEFVFSHEEVSWKVRPLRTE